MAAYGTRAALAGLALALAACSPNPPGAPQMLTSFADPTDHIDLSQMTFAFDRFEGVPGNAADQLTDKIVATAKHEGLTIVQRPGAKVRYKVKGWITAIGNDSATTVVYIYEIFDENGVRVHRIDGQESSSGSSGDPWSAVTDDTLSIIAERTVASLKAWLARDVRSQGFS